MNCKLQNNLNLTNSAHPLEIQLCKRFQFQGEGEAPLISGFAPGPRWGLRSQTSVIGSRSRARYTLRYTKPSLASAGNDHYCDTLG